MYPANSALVAQPCLQSNSNCVENNPVSVESVDRSRVVTAENGIPISTLNSNHSKCRTLPTTHHPPAASRPQMDTSDNLWLDFFISNISIPDTSDVREDVCSHVARRHDQCMERCRINIVSACPHPHSFVVVRGSLYPHGLGPKNGP